MAKSFGREVDSVSLNLYRDSPFVDFVERTPIATAYLLFPDLEPPVQWTATVESNRATWSVSAAQTNLIPANTRVECWIDGEAVTTGTVVRRGDPR